MTTPQTQSLAHAIIELERHVALGGWDAPVGVYGLVHTNTALAADPSLAADLGPEITESAANDPHHVLSIEQDGLPQAENLEELLSQLAWPESVHGMALAVERVALPPSVEAGMPSDPEEQTQYLLNHPERQDVRLVVGVLRSGENWCAVRTRTHDSDDAVAQGPDIAPDLIAALLSTFHE